MPKIATDVPTALASSRTKQKSYADVTASPQPDFAVGDSVWLRVSPRNWIPAQISAKLSAPRSYEIITTSGQVFRRNSSFLRRSYNTFQQIDSTQPPELQSEPQPQPPSRPRRVIKPPQRLNL